MAAANATEALARIHMDALPLPAAIDGNIPDQYTAAELAALRPFLLISNPARKFYRRERTATDTYPDGGILTAWLEVTAAAEDRHVLDNPMRYMKNLVGQIMKEMDAFAHTPGYLAIDRYEIDGPFRIDDDGVQGTGDHLAVMVIVYWNGGLSQ